jgi:beta-lactamase class A
MSASSCAVHSRYHLACVLASVDRGQARMDELIAYGPADLLEWAPVAKQNVEKGAMSVADMCEAAVELSDNTCANALLARFGGPSALTAFWRSIGDTVSRLDHNEPELNRTPPGDPHDTTTPTAIAVTWPAPEEPVLICAYTRGGAPTSRQVDDVFAEIGRYVGMHLSAAV